jgi:hypothetical protein
MDWNTFGTALVTSLCTTGVGGAFLVWIVKTWLGTKIASAIKHEYDKKLESLRASLEQSTAEAVRKMDIQFQDALARKAADRVMFQKFAAALPSSGSVSFVRGHNYAGFSFDRSKHEELEAFASDWDDAEHEFLDPELEALRVGLLTLVRQFLNFVGYNTWPLKTNAHWSHVPPEWEHEQPTRFNEVTDTIHSLAKDIESSHAELVRRARFLLAVPPEAVKE